ncbi:efflux RND transporter permease subunit [Bacteroides thetaiotaomicron]|nr:efflux RND transporter permease subunit [Bacteroides thetaiotaomicron]
MKLDKFINRPVLSTVISILIVILGAIGLATLPITQYPDIAPPTVSVRATYTGVKCINRIELCNCPSGRADQRCRKHDVHDFQRIQYRFR